MQATTDLTEIQWQVADAIARRLVLADADVNEFRKSISYLRAYSDREDAGKKFFDYLSTLARNGNRIGHSKRTQEYLETISKTCREYLESYKDDTSTMLQVLGWAARLMQYYKESGPIGEMAEPTIQSEREAEIQAITEVHNFEAGQIMEAQVIKVDGIKVTYEILGAIKLTEKEHKKAKLLSEGQTVNIQIMALREDSSIKKVKYAG